MEDEVISLIINDCEPVYALAAYLGQLPAHKKDEFWTIIIRLACFGNDQQRFIALSFISLKKHKSQTDLIDKLVEQTTPATLSELLLPILRMVRNLHRADLASYCEDILAAASQGNDEQKVEMALRTILVIDWKRAIGKISEIIENNNRRKIIDILAYFKDIHSAIEWQKLLSAFGKAARKKVKDLELEIDHRWRAHYMYSSRNRRE